MLPFSDRGKEMSLPTNDLLSTNYIQRQGREQKQGLQVSPTVS